MCCLIERAHVSMKNAAEYLEQASKYEALAWQATNDRRRTEYARLAALYRWFAEEVSRLAVSSGPKKKRGPNRT